LQNEGNELNFIVPVPPSINHLYVNQYSWQKDKRTGVAIRVPTGGKILSAEGEKYKKDTKKSVLEQIKDQEWDVKLTNDRHIFMDYIAFMNRKGRDSDNLHKLLQDTLKEIIYIDDSTVLTRPNKILVDRQNPRLEINIKFVDYIGVFDTEDEFNKQLENCKECSSYRKGSCSILKDCYEGIINENYDFMNSVCKKYKVKIIKTKINK